MIKISLLFAPIARIVTIAKAEDIIPKYPIIFIIAIPDLKPANCSSAASSIVSAMKSSFGKVLKKRSLTSVAVPDHIYQQSLALHYLQPWLLLDLVQH